MLVYHVEPLGYTALEGYRIYGKFFNYGRFGATDIPRSLYKNNKEVFEEAEYTSQWLKNKFGKDFPDVSFKISEFWRLDFKKLVEIAKIIGIEYLPSRKPTSLEKRALRKSVLNRITN